MSQGDVMIRAACHCTAVRLEVEHAPRWVYDCNCSVCRRYGVLWAYYKPGEVNVVSGADVLDSTHGAIGNSPSIAADTAAV